jgi:hypothetical protein
MEISESQKDKKIMKLLIMSRKSYKERPEGDPEKN